MLRGMFLLNAAGDDGINDQHSGICRCDEVGQQQQHAQAGYGEYPGWLEQDIDRCEQLRRKIGI